MKTIQITQADFTGSLEELVEAVKAGKLEVAKLDLTQVTEVIEQAREANDDHHRYADALVLLADLTARKAKALLPLEKSDEESGSTAQEITEDFARYKALTEVLDQLEKQDEQSFARQVAVKIEVDEDLNEYLGDVTLEDLTSVLHRVLRRFRQEVSEGEEGIRFREELPEDPFKLADKIELISGYLQQKRKLSFDELFGEARSRLEVVVTFLAMLELIKQGALKVTQERQFGPISLSRA